MCNSALISQPILTFKEIFQESAMGTTQNALRECRLCTCLWLARGISSDQHPSQHRAQTRTPTQESLLPPSCPNPDSCQTGFHNKLACGCSAYWFILGPPSVDSNSKTNLLAPKTSCFYPSVRILVPVPPGFYQWITTLFPGITNPLVHLCCKSKC